jgi:hypothetical protein
MMTEIVGGGIDEAERHDFVSILSPLGSGKGGLLGWSGVHKDLMIATACVKKNECNRKAKTGFDCIVPSGDVVSHDLGDLIEGNVAYAETPYEIREVEDMFLVRFWSYNNTR